MKRAADCDEELVGSKTELKGANIDYCIHQTRPEARFKMNNNVALLDVWIHLLTSLPYQLKQVICRRCIYGFFLCLPVAKKTVLKEKGKIKNTEITPDPTCTYTYTYILYIHKLFIPSYTFAIKVCKYLKICSSAGGSKYVKTVFGSLATSNQMCHLHHTHTGDLCVTCGNRQPCNRIILDVKIELYSII